ncbi:unnamed protein product [Withania somnifera]
MSKQTYKVGFFFRRQFTMAAAEAPADIKNIFNGYSADSGVMSVDKFHRFLIEVQKEKNASLEDAQAIINNHTGIQLDAFFKCLFSDINPPLDPKLGIHHDMTAPLSHYYIYTGHNSYLTGNQLNSDCSDVPIIHALQRGVRVIELDIWPNSEKDDIDVLHGKCLKELPSPNLLKKRVMISTKPPKEYLQSLEVKEKDDSKKEAEGDVSEGEDDEGDPKSEKNAASEYKRLIAIHAGKGKGGLSDWLRIDQNIVRRLSLSEQELEKAVDTHGEEIVRFTQQNLLRIYPKGTRVDSSNYDPFVGWMHGAQMVAFNMQGYGRSLWLMHGMFRANGACGYVKKPDLLLSAGPNNEVFDPTTNFPVKTILKVTLYMGNGWDKDFDQTHFDTYSPPDFYAKVGIAGVPADEVKKKTKTMDDNWIPSWDEQFEFPLTVPELALLRIKVLDYNLSDKDEFAGQTCLPVAELRQGIRAVPLYDRKGEKYSSVKLLMRFEFI